MQYAPPVRRLRQCYIRNSDVPATDEPNESRSALISVARTRCIPTHHHVLPLIKLNHELQSLAVDHPAPGDPHVRRVLRQHNVPSVRIHRIILHPSPSQDPSSFFDHQSDAGSEEDRRRQIVSRREFDIAAAGCETGVHSGLDGDCVVAAAVADGSEIGDGERAGVAAVRWREFDGGSCWWAGQ